MCCCIHAGPLKRLAKMLSRHSVHVLLNEHCTSQFCPRCLGNGVERRMRLHHGMLPERRLLRAFPSERTRSAKGQSKLWCARAWRRALL